jgi:HEAT repeats
LISVKDRKCSVRVEAAFALWKLAPRRLTVDVLGRCLEDPDESARLTAALHLAEIGPAAVPVVPALTRALAVSSGPVQGASARALGKLGPPARAAIPRLIEVHNDLFNIERKSFANAIRDIDSVGDGISIGGNLRLTVVAGATWVDGPPAVARLVSEGPRRRIPVKSARRSGFP